MWVTFLVVEAEKVVKQWQGACLIKGVVFNPELPQMMNTLLESKPRKQRSTGGTIFSVLFHSGILFFAVFATARAGVARDDKDPEQKVHFVKMKKAEPPPV